MTSNPTPPQPATARRIQSLPSSPVRDLLAQARVPGMISLAGGLPSADGFDAGAIAGAFAQALEPGIAGRQSLQYGLTEGEPRLRQALAAWMSERGSPTAADSILVTSGSQQGLDLVARLLLNEEDCLLVERPSYLAALSAFSLSCPHLEGIAADEQGPCLAALDAVLKSGRRPRLLYLVPDFANPTGKTISLARRREILTWAVSHQIVIVEDNPYGELRFSGDALPSLYALAQEDPQARDWVIHLSTLSKIVSPGLRLGWMVLPPGLIEPAVRLKQSMDLHTATVNQTAAAAYLESGRLEARLIWLRAHYRERKQALLDALNAELGDRLLLNDPDGGLFLWGRLQSGPGGVVDAYRWLEASIRHKVVFVPGEAFFASKPDRQSLRLSFATTSPAEMPTAAKRLAMALQAVDAPALA